VLQIENISSQQYNPSDINHLNRRLRDLKVKVKSIEGATSFGANHVLNTNPASLDQGCGLAFVEFDVSNFHNALDNPNNVPGVNVNGATVYDQLFNPTLPQKISLIDPVTGGKVQLETVYSLGPNSKTIAVKAFTHKNTFQSTPITITLPFYNCISFGNAKNIIYRIRATTSSCCCA
jgi:hypothetical protein